MLQWIYELLMSKQDKQVVVQIMQLWLAKPKAFKVEKVVQAYVGTYNAIKSKDFSIEYNLSNGECKLGDLSLQTGWFARKMLQMFSTQQALLCFHENAAKKLLAEETPVKEKPLTANEKREQGCVHDVAMMGNGVFTFNGKTYHYPPQSEAVRKKRFEKFECDPTLTAYTAPFSKRLSAHADKTVIAALQDGSIIEGKLFFGEYIVAIGGKRFHLSGVAYVDNSLRTNIDAIFVQHYNEDDLRDDKADVLPQSVIVKKLYKEKENATPIVLKPPFTEEQIKAISGKKVTAKLRNGDVRAGAVYYREEVNYPVVFMETGYTLGGKFFTVDFRDNRDIIEIKLEGNV